MNLLLIKCFFFSEIDQNKKKNKKRRKKLRDSKYSSGDSDGVVGSLDADAQEVIDNIENMNIKGLSMPSSSGADGHEHGPCCNHADGHSHHNGGSEGQPKQPVRNSISIYFVTIYIIDYLLETFT